MILSHKKQEHFQIYSTLLPIRQDKFWQCIHVSSKGTEVISKLSHRLGFIYLNTV